MRGARLLAAALTAGLGALAAPAHASEEIQSRIEALSREAARISGEMKAGDRRLSEAERDLAALTEHLAELAAREAEARQALERSRTRLRRLIGAFATLSRAPEPAILAHPNAPLAAARASALMGRIGPALQSEARSAERALTELDGLRAKDEQAQARLRASTADLAALREKLEAELAARRADLSAAETQAGAAALEAEAMARALRAAEAFEAALDRAAPPEPAPPARPFAQARGALDAPLTPAALRASFGKAPAGVRPGAPRNGVWLQGAAHGAVRAPWSGKILFAGPFRRLRNVIILEPETGYLIVLGGLAGLTRTAGDTVKAGETIGRLDGPPARSDEFLIEMSGRTTNTAKIDADRRSGPDAAGEMLYMEIRVNGKPADPAPWLRSNEKVSGL